MKRISAGFVLATLTLALLLAGTGGAAAQASNNSTATQPNVPEPTAPDPREAYDGPGTLIQDGLVLVSSEYELDRGTVFLRFDSDGAIAVTLADAGAFMQEGEINRRAVVVDGDTGVRFAVTEVNGYVGVSISTDETLYGHPIKVPREDMIPGGPSIEDTWIAGSVMFVLFAGFMPGAFYLRRKQRGKEYDQH